MATAIILTILSGFLYAVSNVIDKFIVSKHITKPIMVIIFGGVAFATIGLIMLPFVSAVSYQHFVYLFLNACLSICGGVLYLKAIKVEEPSRIVPLFSFITIFIVFLSAYFLKEIFDFLTYVGIGLIIIGIWFINVKKHPLSPFGSRAFWLSITSSFMFATIWIVNKYLLSFYDAITLISYQFIFQGIILLFLLIKYHQEFKNFWRDKKRFVILQWFNETVAFSASYLYLIAISLWFVSLLSAIITVQYIFIFLFVLILNKYKPDILDEKVNYSVILQKSFAIILIIGGIIIITL